jgi:hypothetical protein
MRLAGIFVLMIAMAGVARAEPNITAPPSMTEPLRFEDDVSEMQQIMGPPVALMFGFGLGHVVEGRWHEKGWLFTAGDSIAMTLWMGGMITGMTCERRCEAPAAAYVSGMLGLVALRFWQTADTVTGARAKNRRVMQQRLRMEPLLAPPRGGGNGAVAGLTLRF